MEPSRGSAEWASPTAFLRLALRTVGEERTAFFAARICRNRIADDREAHGTKTAPGYQLEENDDDQRPPDFPDTKLLPPKNRLDFGVGLL